MVTRKSILLTLPLLSLGLRGCGGGTPEIHYAEGPPEEPDIEVAEKACGDGLDRFSRPLWERHRLESDSLRDIQLYSDTEFSLQRTLTDEQAKVTPKDRLQLIKGQHVDVFHVPCETRGVTRTTTLERLEVIFDKDRPDSVLVFVPTDSSGTYCLETTSPPSEEQKQIIFENKEYDFVGGDRPCLLVGRDVLRDLKKTEHTAGGATPADLRRLQSDAGADAR